MTTRISQRLTAVSAALFALLLTVTAHAEQAPPPPGVLETYSCIYREGQDRDDLLAARDHLVRQAERAGITLAPTFVWHTYKGSTTTEFVWLFVHQNLEAFGRNADARMNSEEMASVGPRFDSVADCTPNISYVRQVFNGGTPAVGTPPSLINAFACHLREGTRAEDLEDLDDNIRGTMGSLETHRAYQLYVSNPVTGTRDAPDFFYFGVHDDVSAWSSRTSSLFSSPAGAQLSRHFNSVLDCANALFTGEQLIQGPAS